jgi:hypothetical protein
MVYKFRSAITRGGPILTPEWIIIDEKTVTYRKRNRYLIDFDTITIPISKISSIEVHTGLIGSEIVIKSFGEGEIVTNKFTKSDAHEIKRLLQERQK